MPKLKYIITTYSPLIFDEGVTHSDAAKGLNVESAGFVYVNYDPIVRKFSCSTFGESVSLGIKSSPDMDKLKLDRMLNGAY